MSTSDVGVNAPFLTSTSFPAAEQELPAAPAAAPSYGSPFLTAYATEAESSEDPEATEFAEFVAELYDEEFDDALFELIATASDRYAGLVEGEHADSGGYPGLEGEAMRRLEEAFAPLAAECEAAVGSIAAAVDGRDPAGLDDAELEFLVQGVAPSRPLDPAFENFFGKLKKAVTKAAGKAVGLARKGVKAVAKAGIGAVLRKLQPLVRPLLKRVLAAAINRLPSSLRPHARKLAGRLPFLREAEADGATDDTAVDVAELQQEFNTELATVLFAESEVEMELEAAGYTSDADVLREDGALARLGQAREEFVERLGTLGPGEDVRPHVENFLPALLPALRLGIRLAGRKRVVGFLAGLVSRLIGRFVGRDVAQPLSRALVDAGLRLIQLEATPSDEARAAGSAVAAVVEDTVRQVAALPDDALDDEELLEGYVLEAFEQAAARNLPQILTEDIYAQRPELRQEATYRGAWVALPLRGAKRYRKFTRIPEVVVSPYQARWLRSFGGMPLAGILREQLGLPAGEPVRARAHLYEAIPGTTVADIARLERAVPGLGTARGGYGQLHPLTPEAAGVLLGEPGLGQEVDARYLATPLRTGVGQRLYYLEVAGARPRVTAPGGPDAHRHRAGAHVDLDLPGGEVRVDLFLPESEAQALAQKLRRRLPVGRVVAPLAPAVRRHLLAALGGNSVKVVHARVRPDRSAAALDRVPPAVLKRLAGAVQADVLRGLGGYLRDHGEAFVAAAEEPADGVTVRAVLGDPPGLREVREALAGRVEAEAGGPERRARAVTVRVVAGHGRG